MAVTNPGGGGAGAVAPLTLTGSGDAVQLKVVGNATQTNALVKFQTSTSVDLMSVANDGTVTLGKNDGLTNNVIVIANNGGSQGSSIQVDGSTHQTITADAGAGAYIGGVNMKCVRWDGFNGKLAFFGVAPATQPTGGVKTAAATYSTNEQTMLQTAYNALRTLGLLS